MEKVCQNRILLTGCGGDICQSHFGQEALKGLFGRLKYQYTPTLANFLKKSDDRRMWLASYRGKELVKNRRQQLRLDNVSLAEKQREAEGETYGSGRF